MALNRPWNQLPAAESHGGDAAVVRSRTLVIAATGFALVTLAEYASLIALVPLVLARGFSPGTAAWVLGLGGTGQVAGRVCYPSLSRGAGLPARVAIVSGAVAATIAVLAAVPGPAAVLVTLSIVAGAARGLFTLLGATDVSDL